MSRTRDSIAALRGYVKIRLRKRKILTDPIARQLHNACLAVDGKRARAIPVAQSRFVALDLETTGFYPSLGDEIVSIALLELHGLAFTGNHYNTLVNPGRSIPAKSSAIHGIFDADIRNAPRIDDILPEVIGFLGDAIVVAHHAGFDYRFLNKRLHRRAAITLKNPWIDTMMLYGSWRQRPVQSSLDEVARNCGIIVGDERHSALRDAEIAGEILQFLASELLSDPNQMVGQLIECQFDPDACSLHRSPL
uniref:DNA-directed DNA polymerase n=1 Tax=Candidatus Kentrum sp. MB TaxID=2138164 RepID=A0A450XF50_9GAMM|nr:MAG: DNA polymerase-3 subunit epsilon [Candidatus Kentron sp. MB]VFK27923.1 MAG: DNA polymerase-3 subunit epsilon [Candidatus Kentron sp. MB]VFK74466.1 MAG: DNA polymerase-3 subunit epsilon [Candidatus Kentron sp. MB]